eukprot:m.2334 g.2334  ORF g.2334 m.2334 type:complete len:82 (+) comp8581_c0_seq2:79-324(+)
MGDQKEKENQENVQDLSFFVQGLLQKMQDQFQDMSDKILGRMDEMSGRLDDLEKNIEELMDQAGVEDPGKGSANREPSTSS